MVESDLITRIMKSNIGINVVSIILGLGLASLFKRVCRDNDCLIIKGPELGNIKDKVFKFEEKCYTYEPELTKCKK